MQGMDYVYAVWQEKSFSAAARKLFVSQPVVHLHLPHGLLDRR